MKIFASTIALLCSFYVLAVSVSADESMPAPAIPKAFEPLKQLIGTWEGENHMGDQQVNMTITYELTAGGTAITETMMPGTPQEMVTMYHKEGDKVALTHYCSLGNQPHMQLLNASNKEFVFAMQGNQGIDSPKEAHMHSLTLKLIDKNTLEQHWSHFADGKEMSQTVFRLKRKG